MSSEKEKGQLLSDLTVKGYHIFQEKVDREIITSCLNEISSSPYRVTYLSEQDHSERWKEINLSRESNTARALLDRSTRQIVEESIGPIRKAIFWANKYVAGERVQKHCDGAGDLQIVMALCTPPSGCGGELVIHHGDEHTINLSPGEKLIFRAIETPHETKRIQCFSGENITELTRMVAVCRIYF